MWLMLQQDKPDDYVVATGETHSVKEFINLAFTHAGIEIEWVGDGLNEKGVVKSLASTLRPLTSSSISKASSLRIGDAIIDIDQRYFRPLEVESLQGDASKAREKLNWEPKVRFKELVGIMVDADMKNLEEMKQCQDVTRKLSNNKK